MNLSYRRIFWGIVLILLGLLFILKNLGVVFFAWRELIHLWPLLLVLWGLSLLPVKDYLKVILSLVVVALAFWLIQSGTYEDDWRFRGNKEWHWEWDREDGEDVGNFHEQEFSVPFDSAVSHAFLRFDGGAGAFSIEGMSDELLDVESRGRSTYSMTSKEVDDGMEVRLKMKDHTGRTDKNRMKVKLSPRPVWDLDLDCGAADLDADLSGYRVAHLDLDAGAADIDVRLGLLHQDVTVKIDAGASDVNLKVPEEAGCEIKVDAVLADRNFPGFERIDRGHYRTPGYEDATVRIRIDVDVAVADLSVTRY